MHECGLLYGKPTGLPSGFWFPGEERRCHRPEPVDRCEGGPERGDPRATPGLPSSRQVRAWGRCPAADVEGCSSALGGGPSQAEAPIPFQHLGQGAGRAWWSPGRPEAPVLGTEAQASTQPWGASRPRGSLPAPTPPHAQRGPAGQRTGAAVMLTWPRTLASSRSGCQAGAAGRVARPRLRRGAGWAALLPALAEAPSGFPLPACPPPAPAPLWGAAGGCWQFVH